MADKKLAVNLRKLFLGQLTYFKDIDVVQEYLDQSY